MDTMESSQDWSGYVGTPISAEEQRKQDLMIKLMKSMAPPEVHEVPRLRLLPGGKG